MAFLDSGVKSSELAPNTSLCVTMGEAQVGLFRTGDSLFAIDNICPHRGAPLHDGMVSGDQVTCPWHQWQFQLSDGVCKNIPGVKTKSYPVEVRDGAIWVDVPEKTTS